MQVRIYQPSKTAMQSGRAKSSTWMIEPVLETRRQPEPLMGWTAAGDTYSELYNKLKFDSAEAAAAFAKCRGWSYLIIEPHKRHAPRSNYLDNFKYQSPAAPTSTPPGGKADTAKD